MDFEYAKDSKEQRPYEHYLMALQEIDPIEISERTGIPFHEEEKLFTVKLMGSTYQISYPDYEIHHVEDSIGIYPLEEAMNAKILVSRYLAELSKAVPFGNFLTYHEIPWGETYFRQFQGRCLLRFAFAYGNRLPVFRQIMEHLGAKKCPEGDCSYEMEFMEQYTVKFILWEGDEEFQPSSQILFSDNFAATFMAEDIAVIGDICINLMKAVEKQLP